MELYEMECQNCGAVLHGVTGYGFVTCAYCGSVWNIDYSEGKETVNSDKKQENVRNAEEYLSDADRMKVYLENYRILMKLEQEKEQCQNKMKSPGSPETTENATDSDLKKVGSIIIGVLFLVFITSAICFTEAIPGVLLVVFLFFLVIVAPVLAIIKDEENPNYEEYSVDDKESAKKLEYLQRKISNLEKAFDKDWVLVQYRTMPILTKLDDILQSGCATTLKEAYLVYEERRSAISNYLR